MSGEIKYASLVPTQLDRLLDRANEDEQARKTLQGFRALLVGGQAVPAQLVERAKKLGIKVVVSYGMTETCGGCVFDSVPLDGVRLRIGTDSRLQIQGPVLAQNPNEWLITNDLAELDSQGRLRILGRADRVIISGGLKVSLDAIEQIALTLNGVEQAGATSLENQEFGESVGIAYVGSPEVADTIANALVAELGVASKPVRIIRVDRLPQTATGKTDLIQINQLFRRN